MNGTAEQTHGQLELPTEASGEEFVRIFFQKFAELYFNIEAYLIQVGSIKLRDPSAYKGYSRKNKQRDLLILGWILEEFWRRHNYIMTDYMAFHRLADAAAKARLDLSKGEMAKINLPFIFCPDGEDPIHLELTLTKRMLEELENERQFDRTVH